ncbi:MAG: hydrogenase/urease maturation nickel metallochaperone HypA [Candidatus Omnitrophota bacterium]
MHEIGIVEDIIKSIKAKIKDHSGNIKKVNIRLGREMGLSESSLKLCFESLSKGTGLEGASLDIELIEDKGIFVDSVDLRNEVIK